MACEQSAATLKRKHLWGLALAGLTVLIAALFTVALNSMAKAAAVQNKQADLTLITPDDFGAEVRRLPAAFAAFKQARADQIAPDTTLVAEFERALKRELEAELARRMPPDAEGAGAAVAGVAFSFANKDVLDLLAQRADAL